MWEVSESEEIESKNQVCNRAVMNTYVQLQVVPE